MKKEDDGLTPGERRVLEWIVDKGSITTLEAFVELGESRISARIFALRKKGYPVVGKQIKVKNRYGADCCVKKYFLLGGEEAKRWESQF